MNHIWPCLIKSSNTHPTGDLIPSTSWGASLANMLTSGAWEILRKEAKIRAGGCCELCGAKESSKSSLEAHEMWNYQILDREFGRQKLEGIIAVCKTCHLCFHLGFVSVRGFESWVHPRIKKLNQWSEEEFAVYCRHIFKRWERHSQFEWILDLEGWVNVKETKFKKGVILMTSDKIVGNNEIWPKKNN